MKNRIKNHGIKDKKKKKKKKKNGDQYRNINYQTAQL